MLSGARKPAVPVVPVLSVVPVTNLETPKSVTTADMELLEMRLI